LYREMGLSRAYYSGFSPVVQTPFENLTATDPLREHRLYQASFLLRDYGWNVEDLAFLAGGNLPTQIDPKQAWADQHLLHAPIEIMTATRTQLLRIPGIGTSAADAILQARRQGRITELSHLRRLNIRTPEKAAPYILLNGHRPLQQQSLF
jgi:predicted DNA-binding helix-hairpin-helix protein